MAQPYPTIISGLRSPSEQVKGLVYFGRTLDKIRLAAEGKLPAGWEAHRGMAEPTSFDARCCRFLKIDYAALEAETLKGGSDEALLEWAFKNGRRPADEEIDIWNTFMTKRGWRDAGTQRLNERLAEIGLPPGTVQTMFEFIDLDEGRLKTQTMNSASQDFPRHLNALREKLLHPTDYEAAVYYFLQEFAGDKEFVRVSDREKMPNLVAVLGDVISKALGRETKLTGVLVSYLREYKFVHGNAQADGRIVLFFYFQEADTGLIMLIPGIRGEGDVLRFRLTGGLPDPRKN